MNMQMLTASQKPCDETRDRGPMNANGAVHIRLRPDRASLPIYRWMRMEWNRATHAHADERILPNF